MCKAMLTVTVVQLTLGDFVKVKSHCYRTCTCMYVLYVCMYVCMYVFMYASI